MCNVEYCLGFYSGVILLLYENIYDTFLLVIAQLLGKIHSTNWCSLHLFVKVFMTYVLTCAPTLNVYNDKTQI